VVDRWQQHREDQEREECGAARVRVVIADDHPFFRDGVSRGLTRDGRFAVVGEAGDGLEALELIRRELPDVALVDHQMPGLDGRSGSCRTQRRPVRAAHGQRADRITARPR
jgi:DNA-binding NarL/FixJ family response regulator